MHCLVLHLSLGLNFNILSSKSNVADLAFGNRDLNGTFLAFFIFRIYFFADSLAINDICSSVGEPNVLTIF